MTSTENDLRKFARIGLVHHMLYPRCVDDPDYHERTLIELVRRSDIETLDCCLPYGRDRQERLIDAIRESGKTHLAFAIHLYPFAKLPFTATQPSQQAQARLIIDDMIRQAAAIGAAGFIFAAGGPPFATASAAEHEAFFDFCCWLCENLAKHNIDAMLEPFDYDFDKSFLYGPMERCVELAARVRERFPNFGLEVDVAHLPLMHEDFSQALQLAAPYLKRVHLGNCVSRKTDDPFFGDKHPPIGYAHGDIDVPQIAIILQTLHEIGFLHPDRRGDLVIEIKPFSHLSEDESVADNLGRVKKAWSQVSPQN